MRHLSLLALVLLGAAWCGLVHGGAAVRADPLPPCVDGQYGPGQAGVSCQIRGDTTPTARCWDGTFDYSLGLNACAGHGGVYRWILSAAPATVVSPSIPISGAGTLCADGTVSPSTGPGTCSDHGGEAATPITPTSGPQYGPVVVPSGGSGGCGSHGGPGYRLSNGKCA